MIIKLFDLRATKDRLMKIDEGDTHWNRNGPDLAAEFRGDLNADLRCYRHQLTSFVQGFQKHHLTKICS